MVIPNRLEYLPANTAETVDTYFNCHFILQTDLIECILYLFSPGGAGETTMLIYATQ